MQLKWDLVGHYSIQCLYQKKQVSNQQPNLPPEIEKEKENTPKSS